MLATKKKPVVERVSIMGLKGTREYRDWLDGLVASTGIPLTRIVRQALADWAAGRKLPDPPEGEDRPSATRRKGGV